MQKHLIMIVTNPKTPQQSNILAVENTDDHTVTISVNGQAITLTEDSNKKFAERLLQAFTNAKLTTL